MPDATNTFLERLLRVSPLIASSFTGKKDVVNATRQSYQAVQQRNQQAAQQKLARDEKERIAKEKEAREQKPQLFKMYKTIQNPDGTTSTLEQDFPAFAVPMQKIEGWVGYKTTTTKKDKPEKPEKKVAMWDAVNGVAQMVTPEMLDYYKTTDPIRFQDGDQRTAPTTLSKIGALGSVQTVTAGPGEKKRFIDAGHTRGTKTKRGSSSDLNIDLYDKDGNLVSSVSQTTGQLTPSMKSKIQGNILTIDDGISRLENVLKTFDPKFLEVFPRASIKMRSFATKFLGGGKLFKKDSKTGIWSLRDDIEDIDSDVAKFAVFQQNALSNLNLYIKQITGAQMSEAEAERLRKAVPDPGEGWIPTDDANTFLSKLENGLKIMKMDRARHKYALSKGFSGEEAVNEFPLTKADYKEGVSTGKEDFQTIVNKFGDQYFSKLIKEGKTESEAAFLTNAATKKEFGL